MPTRILHPKNLRLMEPCSRLFILGLVMALFSIVPYSGFSQVARQQTTQIQPAPTQRQPKATYSQNINKANSELSWSRTYFLSFKKTKEAIYLKLAATHCANAVKVLQATQASLPNTTRFYYKAKNKRFSACQFFDELQETALRLDPRHHIQDISANACDF